MTPSRYVPIKAEIVEKLIAALISPFVSTDEKMELLEELFRLKSLYPSVFAPSRSEKEGE